MTKSIVTTTAALLFLTGCGSQGNQASNAPATAKAKGAPYRLAFGGQSNTPSTAGLAIPPIQFVADPNMLETRADLVVKFNPSDVQKDGVMVDQMIMGPTDISGRYGALPADYVDTASKELSKTLADYCVSGKVKIAVALTRSSLTPGATEAQVNAKRISEWLPTEVEFRNPDAKCLASTKRSIEEPAKSIGG